MATVKVGSFDIGEAMATAVVKVFAEKFLSRYVGNGNLKSGAVKLAIAYFLGKNMGNNKAGKVVANALAIDGAEDIAIGISQAGLGMQPANAVKDVI